MRPTEHELARARSTHGDRWRLVMRTPTTYDGTPVMIGHLAIVLECSTKTVNGAEQWVAVDAIAMKPQDLGVSFEDNEFTVVGSKAHDLLLDELRKRGVPVTLAPETFHKFNYLAANRDLEEAFAKKRRLDASIPGHRWVDLLTYVEELEKTAKDADNVGWRSAGSHDEDCGSDGLVRAVSNPSPYRRLVGESMSGAVQEHVLATQPLATMAVAAKLREAFYLMQEASWMVDEAINGHGYTPQELARIATFAKRLALFPSIQVPESPKPEAKAGRVPLTREQAIDLAMKSARANPGAGLNLGDHHNWIVDAIIEASK